MALDAYCDNEGDPASNHVDLEDFSVAPAPGGGGSGGGSGGGRADGVGGLHGPIGVGGKIGLVTKTDPGFIRIEAVRAIQPVPMMAMSGTGGGGPATMTTGGSGTGTVQRLGGSGGSGGVHAVGSGAAPSGSPSSGSPGAGAPGAGGGGIPPGSQTASMSYHMEAAGSGPQPVSLAFTVTNPFDHNFTSVRGTLKIENKVIANKDLGVLFPHQRRTISFAQWTPPRAGTFPVRIELSGLGPGARPLTATAIDQITVGSGAARPGTPAPGGASTRSVIARSGEAGGIGAPAGVLPVTRTRLMTPMILAPAPVAAASGVQTRALLMPTATRALLTASILGLNSNSLVLTPFPAQAGNDVDVSVRLFNSDRLPAKKVQIQLFVDDEKLGEKTMDVPASRTEIASGFKTWKAKPGRHDVRALVAWGGRSGTAAKPIDIHPPHAVGAGGVASLMGRATLVSPTLVTSPALALGGARLAMTRLVITSTDVRLNPVAPAAGTPVDVSVRIQNPGASDANGVRAELFADGVRLGEATGNVPAGRDFVFTGFPRWTPAAGKHVLLCRATASGQVTEATREVTVGAPLTLVRQPLATVGTPVTLATPMGGMGLKMEALARPDLQIMATDFSFAPALPKTGEPVTVTIVVRNMGTGAANGGTVLGILQIDGAESARREFPVTIAAKGLTTLVWPITTPAGTTLTAVARATIADDARADNNEARASTPVAAPERERPQRFIQVVPGN
jgi:hypothetical protein